jgi:tol-pal system beta propeller repeat protein TolB
MARVARAANIGKEVNEMNSPSNSQRVRPRILALVLGGSLLVLALAMPGSARRPAAAPAAKARNGTIAYVSSRAKNQATSLYLMAPNGTKQRPLAHIRNASTPAWSPDGKWLVYAQAVLHCSPGGALHVVRADGTHARRLAHDAKCYGYPAWSPDGKRIAYASWNLAPGELPTIWTMNLTGAGRHQLTRGSTAPSDDPAWSPDGRTIAFRGGFPPAIWLMDADGGNLRRLTTPSKSDQDAYPSWSPTGTRIAFSRLHSVTRSRHWDVYVVSSDGTDLRGLTDHFAHRNLKPDWSPDGTRIVFASDRFHRDRGDIWVMRTDGTHRTRLTQRGLDNESPSWAPWR